MGAINIFVVSWEVQATFGFRNEEETLVLFVLFLFYSNIKIREQSLINKYSVAS